MQLKLIWNDDNFVLIANAAGGSYTIKLLELFVEFRKIGVDNAIMKRELSALEMGKPYMMPFLQSKQLVHTINSGLQSYMLNDLCTGNLPKQLLVAFVRHTVKSFLLTALQLAILYHQFAYI